MVEPVTNKAKALKKLLPERQDLSDPEQVKERDDIGKLIKQQEAADVKDILATEAGRRFMWRTLSQCRMFETTFNSDSHLMAYYEGIRASGIWIDKELRRVDEENYLLMLQENFRSK